MTMTESYYQYHGTEFGSPYRSPRRTVPTATHYGRAIPYGYHDHGGRYHTRQHHEERQVQDVDLNNQNEQSARRRIAVACSRCRKRKIKCTGDPGDGSGCSACKSVGPELASQCTFIRVKSEPVPFENLQILNHMPYTGMSGPSPFDSRDRRGSERHHSYRANVPVLHTRYAFPADLDSPIHASPVDAYTYGTSAIPRQDSFGNIYGTDGSRSWSLTCSSAIPPTTTYCDPHTGLTFPSMQFATPQFSRLPSVSSESLSALNMGHLNSSLPSQAAQHRRLPVPYVSQFAEPPYTQPEPMPTRPLGSFSAARIPVNNIGARNSIPWTLDTTSSRARSVSAHLPANTLAASASYSMPTTSESVMGYHMPTTSQAAISTGGGGYISSPDLSPTATAPTLSTSFDSSSSSSGSSGTVRPIPTSAMHYGTSTSSQAEMSLVTSTDRPTSSRMRQTDNIPTLYSYTPTGSDIQSTTSDQDSSNLPNHTSRTMAPSSGVSTYSIPVRDGRNNLNADDSPYTDQGEAGAYPASLQHPRPVTQNSVRVDNLCRQPSFEQQQQQAQQPPRSSSTASRMSISNFSGSYQ